MRIIASSRASARPHIALPSHSHMEQMRPTVSNFRLQIELALMPRCVHVGPRLARAPRHRRTANAFAAARRRISGPGRGRVADQVATGTRHYWPVRAVPPPSARDLWNIIERIVSSVCKFARTVFFYFSLPSCHPQSVFRRIFFSSVRNVFTGRNDILLERLC